MQIRQHVAAVLLEEVKRQRRRRAEVARTAGLNKNALYRLTDGATLTVDSLWSLAESLDVSMEEIVARVSLLARRVKLADLADATTQRTPDC